MSVSIQLRIIPAASPRPVQAGYLPGSDVHAWLAEMARHAGARFFLVPESAEASEAGGLLIIPESTGKPAATLSFGPRVIPCHLEHQKVAVPAGQQLDPLLTDDEVRRLLPYPAYFYHPALGLVGFEESDAILPQQLIVPPLTSDKNWGLARGGSASLPALSSVMLMMPSEPQGLFGDASGQISSESLRDLLDKDLPLKKIGNALKGGALAVGAGALAALAKMLGSKKSPPATGAGRSSAAPGNEDGRNSLLGRLGQWTLAQVEKLQQQREQEIRRLLEMLEKDPARGLRHAIPFGGDAGRGVAAPGSQLGFNDPSYGFRRRGGPVDVWNLTDQAQLNLQRKYRQLASQEIAQGRFDRAAYIFAELLGDWHSAAEALERGKRFQEAAQIYKSRLGNLSKAALCLESGGLLQDAVLVYAELKRHETCGDLLRRLGKETEAVAAYQLAIQNNENRLDDARILFEKLHQHEMAFAVLAKLYPHSTQAGDALKMHFEYLHGLQAHDQALALVRSVAAGAERWPNKKKLVQTLSASHRTYAEPAVREKLATEATRIIGTAVTQRTDLWQEILGMLSSFSEADRLLSRDASRHQSQVLQQLREERRKAPESAKPDFTLPLRRKSLWELAKGEKLQWRCLQSRGNFWLATGHHMQHGCDCWTAGRSNQIIGNLFASWQNGPGADLQPVLPSEKDAAWIPSLAADGVLRYVKVTTTDFSTARKVDGLIGRLVWIPTDVRAIHPVKNGCWVLHGKHDPGVVLSFYSCAGGLIRTHAMRWPFSWAGEAVHMVAHDQFVFMAYDNVLLLLKQGSIERDVYLNSKVSHLVASRPTQPAAVLVVAGDEVLVMGAERRDDSIQLFKSSASQHTPVGCILADGRMVAGDENGLYVYSAFPTAKHLYTLRLENRADTHLVSVVAWEDAGLALLWNDGRMECYEP